ncbi:MAG: phosphate starvation-inducible protein PhoH, partial [Candidatus Marinimicrobia bacterium]|nr:phosphate starvation-inducible protein PhoH [Candidatus Neomarinimicrobiota bacterium]
MKKVINLGSNDPISILGTNDQNLKILEKEFKSTITVRGTNMILNGSQDETILIEKIVQDMQITANRKGYVDEDDVRTLISFTENDSSISEIEDPNRPLIVYTHKGSVNAVTPGQKIFLEKVNDNDITFAVGPAGTGKTYLAVAFAVAALKNKIVERIVITRPAVEAGENLGFLPGDLKEKIDPYLNPIYDALRDMIKNDRLEKLMDRKIIEVAPLAYMRGRTLQNAFIILDEAQNATKTQMKMFLTRLGVTSKAIVTGDITQIDLPKKSFSGLLDALQILKNVKEIGFVNFEE